MTDFVLIAAIAAAVLAAVSALLSLIALLTVRRGAGDRSLRDGMAALPDHFRREVGGLREDAERQASAQRLELQGSVTTLGEGLEKRFQTMNEFVGLRLNAFADLQKQSGETLTESQKRGLSETNASVLKLVETMQAQQVEARKAMGEELEKVRVALTENLEKLRKENEAKLEVMRQTVDEKLQSTLDQRLDASFKQVSDRLESVQKGLGEMQTLATGVGDLKKVLTNVKARGTWGEVQLGALLEDTLTSDQYDTQVQVRPRSPERVDFAVRLPGQDENGQVWLPIDCKFPHEDYERLVAAQEAANPVEAEAAGKALERAVAAQARAIAEKYIHPPHSTDFAYMYLPTEGLFAEIVRRQGFAAGLREKYRVELAGPSTLTALLNSLRVGFRSLQIQKKSSEVWTELGKVKAAFEKYGDALEAVDAHLDKAKNKVSEVSKRHQAVVRSLRNVESTPLALDAPSEVMLALADDSEPADAET